MELNIYQCLRKHSQSKRGEQRQTVSTKKPEHIGAGKEVQGLKEMKMREIAKPRCLRLQICCNGSRNYLSSAVVLPFTYH